MNVGLAVGYSGGRIHRRTGAVERATRRQLRGGTVLHEHELVVDLQFVSDVVVQEFAGRPALVGALEEVGRSVVVGVVTAVRVECTARIDREAAILGSKPSERTRAGPVTQQLSTDGVGGAGAEIALRFEQ